MEGNGGKREGIRGLGIGCGVERAGDAIRFSISCDGFLDRVQEGCFV